MNPVVGAACARPGCDNRGKPGLNIVGYGSFATKLGRRQRYRCTVCRGTVSTNTGTAYPPERRAAITDSLMVFTAKDIQRSGASSLADVVQQIPGLHVEANGRQGALTSLFARGGESDYNHVLVDGVRVNISGGQFERVSHR